MYTRRDWLSMVSKLLARQLWQVMLVLGHGNAPIGTISHPCDLKIHAARSSVASRVQPINQNQSLAQRKQLLETNMSGMYYH
jgi:hypothetical protein